MLIAHAGGGLPPGKNRPPPVSDSPALQDPYQGIGQRAHSLSSAPQLSAQPVATAQPYAADAAVAQANLDMAQQPQHAYQAQLGQRAQHAQQAQHNMLSVKFLPPAVQQVQQSAALPQQQPASPAGRELTHVVDFMTPEAESVLHHKEFAAPAAAHRAAPMAQRIAELQRGGQEEGSGGSLEGESVMQLIPAVQPAEVAAAEEAEYGQMVQELQQVSTLHAPPFVYLVLDNICVCVQVVVQTKTKHCYLLFELML